MLIVFPHLLVKILVFNKLLCNQFPGSQSINFGQICKVTTSILNVHHGQCRQKTKNSVPPIRCHPHPLYGDWVHSCQVMIIDHISVFVVVVYDFWIEECTYLLDLIHSVVPLFFLAKFVECSIRRHYHHRVVWFLHCI